MLGRGVHLRHPGLDEGAAVTAVPGGMPKLNVFQSVAILSVVVLALVSLVA